MFNWLFRKGKRVTKVTPPKKWFTIEEIEKALSKVDEIKEDIIERKIKEESLSKIIKEDKTIVDPNPNRVIKITECQLKKAIDEVANGYGLFFDSSVEHKCFQDNLSTDVLTKINEL